jgi:hypothetical protein
MPSLITIVAVPVAYLVHHPVLAAVVVAAEAVAFVVVVWRVRRR